MRAAGLIAGTLVLACASAGCAARADAPDRESLRRDFLSHDKIVIVVPASGEVRSRVDDLVSRYRNHHGEKAVRVVSDDASLPRETGEAVILAGTPPTNRLVGTLMPLIPLQWDEKGFAFGGTMYHGDGAAILMLAPDGPQPRRLLLLSLSRSAQAAARGVAMALFSDFDPDVFSDDYRVRPGGLLERAGRFIMSGDPPWKIDPAKERDGEREREAFHKGLVELRAPGVIVRSEPGSVDSARAWAEARSRARGRPVSIQDDTTVTFILYPTIVDKGRFTGNVEEAHVDPTDKLIVHTVLSKGAEAWADLAAGEARVVARMPAGQTVRPWLLDGEAVARLGSWNGRSPAEWCTTFQAAGVLPSLAELLSTEKEGDQSPLVFVPSAGRLAALVKEKLGDAQWQALLRGGKPPGDLDRLWPALAGRGAVPARKIDPEPLRVPSLQKGACLAHVNDLARGYASAPAGKTLQHLRSIGVNWVSVTPFGFMRRTNQDRIDFVLDGPFAETDSQMRAVIDSAHGLGLSVLYKPHLWVGGPGWVGDIAMDDDAAWKRWFASYRKFAVHHALLAAECGAEGFVIGTELMKTTHREADWRETIAAVRRVFPGWITYGANWWDEFDRVAFWDALDAVAIDLYEPLSKDAAATDADLLAGARKTAERVETVASRARRPAILTEVGFPSRTGGWVSPHEEIRGAPVDPAAQARGYRAVFQAFWGRKRIAGMYWWKFESADFGSPDGSLTPRGKPAEEIIREYYLAPSGAGGVGVGASGSP